ncbi:MAG: hypothetical protein M5U28_12045 [Sandaracinaceae bacterium]|nr:hypothetical protein [Sandaracinaceae bacterium]
MRREARPHVAGLAEHALDLHHLLLVVGERESNGARPGPHGDGARGDAPDAELGPIDDDRRACGIALHPDDREPPRQLIAPPQGLRAASRIVVVGREVVLEERERQLLAPREVRRERDVVGCRRARRSGVRFEEALERRGEAAARVVTPPLGVEEARLGRAIGDRRRRAGREHGEPEPEDRYRAEPRAHRSPRVTLPRERRCSTYSVAK